MGPTRAVPSLHGHRVRRLVLPASDLVKVETGSPLRVDQFTTRIRRSTDVFVQDPTNGETRLLFSFRKNGIPNHQTWFSILDECFDTPILTSDRRFRAAGAPPKTRIPVRSGVIGFYDRLTPQQKALLGRITGRNIHTAGRATAFTRRYPDRWRACLPLFQKLSRLYRRISPSYYKTQKTFVDQIEPELRIDKTVFTTVTVNQNWATHTHTDKGDFGAGMSCLAVLGRGFDGGFLGFPRRKILVEIKPGDVIFMDAHEPHGNTPLDLGKNGEGKRMSLVCYARTDLARFHRRVVTPGGETFFVQ